MNKSFRFTTSAIAALKTEMVEKVTISPEWFKLI
jgi:hypothetical protein